MDPVDLEQLTDRHLRRLPRPVAPGTLLPRVMAAVRLLAERPWYARPWVTWPLAGQALSGAVVCSIVLGLIWIAPGVEALASQSLSRLAGRLIAPFAGTIEWMGQAAFAARVVWESVLQPLVFILLVLVLLMFAACAAFGAALDRVALGGASRS